MPGGVFIKDAFFVAGFAALHGWSLCASAFCKCPLGPDYLVNHKPGCTVMCLHVSLLASKYCQCAHLSSTPLYDVRGISTELLAGDKTEADTASRAPVLTHTQLHQSSQVFLFRLLGTLSVTSKRKEKTAPFGVSLLRSQVYTGLPSHKPKQPRAVSACDSPELSCQAL